jgi:hypothetical protein
MSLLIEGESGLTRRAGISREGLMALADTGLLVTGLHTLEVALAGSHANFRVVVNISQFQELLISNKFVAIAALKCASLESKQDLGLVGRVNLG